MLAPHTDTPRGLMFSERQLWARADGDTRAVLLRLVRFRDSTIRDLHTIQELEAEIRRLGRTNGS